MKAMILAAGLGMRMRPLTDHCPKPLLPLLVQPILDHILAQLPRHGIRDVIINLHHHADQLARWLGDGSRWGVHLSLSFEPEILGTAGALKRVEPLLQDAPFFVLNADVLIDVDLQALWRWHCQRQALVTMVLRPDPAARSYGAVLVDADERVRLINGRPSTHVSATGEETMFACVQVVEPQVLERIPPGCFSMTTSEVYPALIERHEAVYGYRYTGYWMDIGTPERYLQAHWDMLDGVLGDAWVQRLPTGSRVVLCQDATPSVAPGVTLVPPVVLGPDVELAPDVHLGPYAVLGAGCRLASGAVVRESVLWEGVQVGAGAQVRGCTLATGVQVPAANTLVQAVLNRGARDRR
jgi:mannose-1-phosphate guanylyltransferase